MGDDLKLGMKARDTLTGYEGVISAQAQYLAGCDRVKLERLEAGKVVEEWFDVGRVQAIASTPAEG